MTLSFIIIALCAGFALAIQAAINSQLAGALIGQPVVAAFISFLTGTIVLLGICWWKADLVVAWQHLPKQPWWKFIGGPLGALVVFTTIFLAPKIGVTNMLFFIIVGQLIAAMLIDHFGLLGMNERPMQIWQIIGLLFITLGLTIFFFGKKIFG
ncbi:MAG: DMT family transporter [[Actinobacillus] rossii]|uniref:Orotate transporter n=1 Tax=[Actinobacillus] rossii TaxID=123820 RepID=A0A380TPQ7_9PAST|nr:DMT family transporter [[Actinobacillus] rossii]MDY3123873.1 DMT family transporter [[Actinobacillus] rossii]MDY4505830.1 DMT family transporter [[Actinobacillus] rossii]SUT89979.1 orotate transporter [[Actinobacillus] rossii]